MLSDIVRRIVVSRLFATILPYKHKGENTQVVIQATITRVTHDDSCCATAQRRLCLESVLSFRNINSLLIS